MVPAERPQSLFDLADPVRPLRDRPSPRHLMGGATEVMIAPASFFTAGDEPERMDRVLTGRPSLVAGFDPGDDRARQPGSTSRVGDQSSDHYAAVHGRSPRAAAIGRRRPVRSVPRGRRRTASASASTRRPDGARSRSPRAPIVPVTSNTTSRPGSVTASPGRGRCRSPPFIGSTLRPSAGRYAGRRVRRPTPDPLRPPGTGVAGPDRRRDALRRRGGKSSPSAADPAWPVHQAVSSFLLHSGCFPVPVPNPFRLFRFAVFPLFRFFRFPFREPETGTEAESGRRDVIAFLGDKPLFLQSAFSLRESVRLHTEPVEA